MAIYARKSSISNKSDSIGVPEWIFFRQTGFSENVASKVSKIFIQIFAVVAEFERNTLTECIMDNMMEHAKDGRWLGGNTPMGFTVRRVITGSGKGKSAYSYLESTQE